MFFSKQKKRRNFFRKAQVAPYQAHRFKNPYFRAKAKAPTWPLAAAGAAIGLLIALSSFFITAPIFTISSVRVEGAETINPKEIRDLAEDYLSSRSLLFFKTSNRLFFNEEKMRSLLEDKYSFSTLDVKREKQTLAIIFKEKISSFLWLTNSNSYLLDETGSVIRATPTEETELILSPPLIQGPTKIGGLIPETVKILVFQDLANKPISVGDAVLLENEVYNVRTFFEAMYSAGIIIDRFELNRSIGSWLKAETQEGFDLLFDPSGDVLQQADNVLLLLKDQVKDRSALEYIDVRFGDHVYYK
ncbi:MAG: hypothetical protein UX09_C0004G0017 [Candidatus Uhrbacteria bacterium GW2011_GWE2_45_35]|uniref:POTRA domain-containing protein n=2 Tax=Candidatus Uhriibacteriota TaxID=1752732 RepID=A0A0G1JKX3_9BACT|nr:MAG: hypothetical protein UW63_C0002G0011 [Candidatus Uhrbacteria bacterium GW2011_GWF2_44_350]KKU09097.1 MAG: hypothetical protein UX09_C0004G0017 [Candidatus Uhrbacteria bacterium GW2011_GWE2_45_35]HBR80348.1 hypothetical protein [Candidatus Uhrbacteria bacterium]HCU31285.1 hypothetical protein [Candidatus Uhrbacteria bacterium]